MRIKQIAFVLVLAALVLSSAPACRKKSPTGPTPDPGCTTNCTPTGDQYQKLKTKYYLQMKVKAADGTETEVDTKMFYILQEETKPPRASAIVQGAGACPGGCFRELKLDFGAEGIPNPATTVNYKVGFGSEPGVISRELVASSNGGTGNGVWPVSSGQIWAFFEVPKYLVILAWFPGSNNDPQYGTYPGQTGAASILLDYRQ